MNNLYRIFRESTSAEEYGRRYAGYVADLLTRVDFSAVAKFVEILEEARKTRRTVFFVGNGGSAATASHWANDLSLGTRVEGMRPFRAVSLTDNVSVLTALGNDRGYADVFVGQLEGLFQAGDVLVAISASGNSPNVLRAIDYANGHGGTTVGFVGFDGGSMKALCHLCIHVETPHGEYGAVEGIHLILEHLLTGYLRARLEAARGIPRAPGRGGTP